MALFGHSPADNCKHVISRMTIALSPRGILLPPDRPTILGLTLAPANGGFDAAHSACGRGKTAPDAQLSN
jgi:hypothetical protein